MKIHIVLVEAQGIKEEQIIGKLREIRKRCVVDITTAHVSKTTRWILREPKPSPESQAS